jgi:hypothetical protein
MSDHWRVFVMHILWSHVLVISWRMVLSEIITHIGVTRCPTYIELVLFNSVFYPAESRVHCFGALLLDCVIDDAICGGVVSFELCGILCVAHFRKCCACDSSFFSIHKNGTTFGLSHEKYHIF